MHADGELKKEGDDLYDLVGFESNEPVKPRQIQPARIVGVQDSSMSFTEMTVDDLLLQVLEQTLIVYHCSERLAPLEIINSIDADELAVYKEDAIVPMMKLHPHLQNQKFIDLGNYPVNPWLDAVIPFKS